MTKPHNILSIKADTDPDGVTFTLTVKIDGGVDLKLNGPEAIPVFYTLAGFTCEQYEDDIEVETVH